MSRLVPILVYLFLSCFWTSCQEPRPEYVWKSLEVTVSAYNSVSWQTSGNPNITAWGDTLKPGMRCIAVSRDLIAKGLKHNTQVKIEGLEMVYLVKDKMNMRWKNRIDIYMGTDVNKARYWGKKKLKIQYAVENDSTVEKH